MKKKVVLDVVKIEGNEVVRVRRFVKNRVVLTEHCAYDPHNKNVGTILGRLVNSAMFPDDDVLDEMYPASMFQGNGELKPEFRK